VTIKIATYNVNSIRAREERVVEWLTLTKPDIVCLQELKVEDLAFPSLVMKSHGYESATFGQKTYNGVAILSKSPLTDVTRGFDTESEPRDPDPQARFITAKTAGITIMSAYFPNGESKESDKFQYKLRWLERLTAHLQKKIAAGEEFILAGDFNIAPEDLDCHDPLLWADSVLACKEVRHAWKKLIALGLTDTVRVTHPDTPEFTWWDYRMLAFPKKKGLRIDHLLATPGLATRLTGAGVDRDARKGKQPSDHAPVWIELRD
jgi:exodeoxyribonuclease-3